MKQLETEIFEGEDPRKYEVGVVLTFRNYQYEEVQHLGDLHRDTFQRGDKLIVEKKNGGAFGIVVTRLRDGECDMVWSSEVAISRRQIRP